MPLNQSKAINIGAILHNGNLKYRIAKVLGSGGFGITYLATAEVKVGNVFTEASFAIKEHFPESICHRTGDRVEANQDKAADFAKSKGDFMAEARKLHALGASNNNIIKVNEAFEENGTAYYVMQYLKGQPLSDYVLSNGKLAYTQAAKLLAPIFRAVDFLHRSRINHLDIKPENIMLRQDMDGLTPVLIDFGLSVHFDNRGNRTTPLSVIGISEGYSPIEQYAGITEFSPQADVYSLAATLLFALTGQTPPKASAIKASDISSSLAGMIPKHAENAICKAMAKSADSRTSSVAAFMSGLGMTMPGMTSEASVHSYPPSCATRPYTGRTKPLSAKSSHRGALLICLGIAAALAVAAALYIKLSPKSESARATGNAADSTEIVQHTTIQTADTANTTPSAGEIANNIQQAQATIGIAAAPEPSPSPASPAASTNSSYSGTLSFGYATWEGAAVNGKPDGKGKLTFQTKHRVVNSRPDEANPGDYFIGTYDAGSLISGKLYDKDGNVITTIIP